MSTSSPATSRAPSCQGPVTMPATRCTCDAIPYQRDGRVHLDRILADRCCEATHEDEEGR